MLRLTQIGRRVDEREYYAVRSGMRGEDLVNEPGAETRPVLLSNPTRKGEWHE